jgi:hypothetical protein
MRGISSLSEGVLDSRGGLWSREFVNLKYFLNTKTQPISEYDNFRHWHECMWDGRNMRELWRRV